MSRSLPLLLCAALIACSDTSERFPATGVVRGVDPASGQVLIEHDAIEGLMDAMTMSFDASEATAFETLAEGQIVEFVAVRDDRSFRATDFVVTGSIFAAADTGFENLARVGESAPAIALADEEGNLVSLDSLRGRVILLDFVYTSCPGPCPILSATHVSLQKRLERELRDRVHFVSVSLDPERDTPAARQSYAEAHGMDLDHWSLLGGDREAVDEVLEAYGVGSTRQEDGEIEHIVATFLIDGRGEIVQRYLGLEHTPAELHADIRRNL